MKAKPEVIVFGEIGLVRCLGEAGIQCMVAIPQSVSFVEHSRYSHRRFSWPSFDDPDAVNQVKAVAQQCVTRPIVMADTDSAILFFSRHRNELEQFVDMVLPDPAVVESVVDKRLFAKLAERCDLPVPRTASLTSFADIERLADGWTYPAILKPSEHRHWGSHYARFEKLFGSYRKGLIVKNPSELIGTYRILEQEIDNRLILQEYIPGNDEQLYDLHIYLNANSQPLGAFVGQKLRTYPIHFGMGCYKQPVYRPDIIEIGVQALQSIGYRGAANINFKQTPSGELKILEINPRYSLWIYLSHRCGLNIPQVHYRDRAGHRLTFASAYRTDTRWWYANADLHALFDYRSLGEWSWWRWLGSLCCRKVYHVFSWQDPMPILWSLIRFLRLRLCRTGRTLKLLVSIVTSKLRSGFEKAPANRI